MNMPSLNVERMLVTLVIMAFIHLHGCEMNRVPEDFSSSSTAEKPTESHEGWPHSEASSSVSSSAAEVEAIDPLIDVHELCEKLTKFLASLPGAEVRKSPGQGNDYLSGVQQSRCHVRTFGRFSALKGDNPGELVRNKFQAMGWKEELRFAADGPDGTSFAFRRDPLWCQIRGAWDGGDDSDPGYEPSDEYIISVTCTKSSGGSSSSIQNGKP